MLAPYLSSMVKGTGVVFSLNGAVLNMYLKLGQNGGSGYVNEFSFLGLTLKYGFSVWEYKNGRHESFYISEKLASVIEWVSSSENFSLHLH